MAGQELDRWSLSDYMPAELAAAIGRALSAWARFEYEIDELIWELARLEPTEGACLTAQFYTVATRFNSLMALARVQKISDAQIKRLNVIRRKSDALAEQRNRLAHDPWFYGFDTQETYRLQKTARATLIHRYELVSVEDIQKIERDTGKLISEFRKVRSDVLHAFWSSP
jgi:hypothetical protein